MKKGIIVGLLLIVFCIVITGCTKKEEENNNNRVYSCVSEGETDDGGNSIIKLVITLDQDDHTVSYQVINDDTFTTEELYERTVEARKSNVREHEEKYSNAYKWIVENDNKKKRSVSTKTYDLKEVTSAEGHLGDEYQYYRKDGTYDVVSWMQHKRDEEHYICS